MTDMLTLEDQIDNLGRLNASIATLTKEAEKIKEALKKDLIGAHDGELFRVTVTKSTREVLDMEAVRLKLSPQFIRAHTTETEVTTLRVTARKGA